MANSSHPIVLHEDWRHQHLSTVEIVDEQPRRLAPSYMLPPSSTTPDQIRTQSSKYKGEVFETPVDAEHVERKRTESADTPSNSLEPLKPLRSALGLHPEAPIDEEDEAYTPDDAIWPKVRAVFREPFTEFWGTFILVGFGNGSVAQVILSNSPATGGNSYGSYQSINWGWGLGIMLGIYVAGDSGAYLNPAVTFTNCWLRRLPWRRFPIYLLAQFLGGFVASAVVYANYVSAIDRFAGHGVRTVPPAATATAQIFATYPQPFLTKTNQFFSEFIASAFLMFVIFALKDDGNNGVSRGGGNWFPLALFFLVFGLGCAFGWETGYAINLARDFGPRLMSYILGYRGVWSAGGYYFWIPMVAPFLGCAFGGFLYDLFIYTGPESPINTHWMGLKKVVHIKKTMKERRERDRVRAWEPEEGKAELVPPK